MSFGPVGWVLPSEVFPLSIRSRGVAISTASNWFNNCGCCLSNPISSTKIADSPDWSSHSRVDGALAIVRDSDN
jgi:hypothetical protein